MAYLSILLEFSAKWRPGPNIAPVLTPARSTLKPSPAMDIAAVGFVPWKRNASLKSESKCVSTSRADYLHGAPCPELHRGELVAHLVGRIAASELVATAEAAESP